MAQSSDAQDALQNFWPRVTEEIQAMTIHDLKQQELPLARIKKIMKLDEDVKMISAEAPVLFAKAAEIFIHELTLRAWIHTEDNRRRTLQRNDIAMAITKFDQFDFLIDIVPRDEIKPSRPGTELTKVNPINDQVQYYFQLAQQHQTALQQTSTNAVAASATTTTGTTQQPQTIQIVNPGGAVQTINLMPVANVASSATTSNQNPISIVSTGGQQQIIQLQPNSAVTNTQTVQQPVSITQNATTQAQQQGGVQIIQQVIGPNGEIQQIPITLSAAHLQMIRANQTQSSPIILQANPIASGITQAIQGQQQILQVAAAPQGPTATPVYLAQSTSNTAASTNGQS